MSNILRKFCTNFLFVFFPRLASVPDYPKYLGMDKNHPELNPPPLDTLTIFCIKLFFGGLFDSLEVGLVFVIISWFFTSFFSAFSHILFYTKFFLGSVFVYLILYSLGALVGNKTGILPSSPETSRKRIWAWARKSRSRPTINSKDNEAISEQITEEDELFYSELRKDLRRRKELAIEGEYQKSLKEFHQSQNKSKRVVTRTSNITGHQISSVILSSDGGVQTQGNHVNDLMRQPGYPDYNENLTNFSEIGVRCINICPYSEARECKVKAPAIQYNTATLSKKPAKKRVNFEVTNNDKEMPSTSSDRKFIKMNASQYKLRNDYDNDGKKITQQETTESKKLAAETAMTGNSKMHKSVRNPRALTPILKRRPGYLQQHRERKGTPPYGSAPEPALTHRKLYSPEINKNVKFEKPKKD